MLSSETERLLKLSASSAAVIYRSIIQSGQWVSSILDITLADWQIGVSCLTDRSQVKLELSPPFKSGFCVFTTVKIVM